MGLLGRNPLRLTSSGSVKGLLISVWTDLNMVGHISSIDGFISIVLDVPTTHKFGCSDFI